MRWKTNIIFLMYNAIVLQSVYNVGVIIHATGVVFVHVHADEAL
jgi:hypothetical protein